jgi:murein DD-endopeptidase MepM/ murein hydrolase activator NlpD
MAAAATPAIVEGRRWTALFHASDPKPFWDGLAPDMQKLFVHPLGVTAFRKTIELQAGVETAVLDETTKAKGAATIYIRTAKYSKSETPIELIAATEGGKLVGFAVQPTKERPAPTTKLDYVTRSSLRLPFEGTWVVGWGGRTVEKNHHVVVSDQRFAYDFLVEEKGSTHRGDGTKNTDYFCYGRPILAPADGSVVDVVDGVPENVPGEMDATHPAGNYVILDHGHGEFSLLAHLVPGSLTVHRGERVASGRVLGRCGNSGHSSEPHLHYHLQDSDRFGDAEGLPAQFRHYFADDVEVDRGEPERGQRIRR